MGEFNVDKTTGDLISTAGYGGYIKKTGTTISELVTALNDMTEEQKDRCIIAVICQGYNSIFRLQCSAKIQSTGAFIFKWTSVASASYTQQVILNTYDSTIKLVDDKNSTVVDMVIISWKLLYQDDSPSGGNTYPANQVVLTNGGGGSVEDALDDVNNTLDDVNNVLDSIGDNVFIYPENTNVPSATMTTIATVSITKAGIYMLYGGCSFSSSFSDLTILRLYANTSEIKGTNIRANGLAGGGMNTCAIYKKTNSTAININMQVYQGASSTATAIGIALGAVLIKEL